MRRHLPPSVAALAALTIAPALVVLPTVSLPTASPHPVKASVVSLPLSGVDPAALADVSPPPAAVRAQPAVAGPSAGLRYSGTVARALSVLPVVLTARKDTAAFDLVALTWDGVEPAGTTLQVRVREHGAWTSWEQLGLPDDGPDGGSRDATLAATGAAAKTVQKGVTAPLLVDRADAVQVRVDSTSGKAPSGLRLQLVDAGTSAADSSHTPAASALADTSQPTIITRAQWGADESLVKAPPQINPTVKALFLHHTDTTNNYTPEQAYAQVRAVYVFHTKVRGWNDIGYNFVVDKFGRVFEGRKGSLTDAVQGAHTAGFNEQTLGIAALGQFSSTKASAAMIDGIVDVMSWKAAAYGIDPRTTTTLVATSGSNKYSEGQSVSMRTVSGHRDGYLTECPGNALYPLLPSIRAAIAQRMAPGLVSPQTSADVSNAGGAAIGFTAVFPTVQRWWLSMTPMCATDGVQVLSGRSAGRINATWNLDDSSGAKLPPGVYRLTMITSSPVGTAPTWTKDVELLPTPGGPAATCPVVRLGTGDLVAGSVIAGRAAYPDAHSVVIVGSGARLDALVAAPLARVKGAPLLLSGASALPAPVVADIQSRGVQTAWIVGSTASVGAAVESQLKGLGVGTVTRLSGPDRYTMAAAVAKEVGAGASSAVVVSGENGGAWDAVAAAGPAAATGRPLLFVTSTGVPAATAAALKSLTVTNVLVVGSAQAVPNAVVAKLGLSGVRTRARVTGADRYATAVAVANAFSRPVPADRVVVAPGGDAGIGWAAIAGSQGRLLVLTDPTSVPAVTSGWLSARKPGTVALVSDTRNASTALLRQLYTITR